MQYHYSFDGGEVTRISPAMEREVVNHLCYEASFFETLNWLSMKLLFQHMEALEAEQEKTTDAVHR